MRPVSGETPRKTLQNTPKTTLPTLSTPSFSHLSPHICPFLAPLAPFLPSTPPTAHRATLTPSQPQNQSPHPPQPPHAPATPRHKKGESSPHSHPRQLHNSTNFNLSPFNLHPKLNASVNNLQPKFNPLQPFAHFVFSLVHPPTTRNSLIFRRFIVFRLNTSLYISFSCPYLYAFAFWGQIYRLLKSFGLYCFVVYFRSTISPMSLTPGRISRFMSCRTLTCSESP